MDYNGHKNWTHWNVSLWISNDFGLYSLALDCKQRARTLASAARMFIADVGTDRTPDGAKYSRTAVCAALADLD